jgi:hypothetical protein
MAFCSTSRPAVEAASARAWSDEQKSRRGRRVLVRADKTLGQALPNNGIHAPGELSAHASLSLTFRWPRSLLAVDEVIHRRAPIGRSAHDPVREQRSLTEAGERCDEYIIDRRFGTEFVPSLEQLLPPAEASVARQRLIESPSQRGQRSAQSLPP